MDAMKALEKLHERGRELKLLAGMDALLGWDQEVMMPSSGIDARAEQLSWLSARAHERSTSPEIGEWLEAAGSTKDEPMGPASLPDLERRYLRYARRQWEKDTRIPVDLVAELSKATSKGVAVWTEARKAKDFEAFRPSLEEIFELRKRIAACAGPGMRPYDYYLDEFEWGASEAGIEAVFSPLARELSSLIEAIKERPSPAPILKGKRYPKDAQEAFGREVMADMGMPPERSRLDVSAHPFTTSIGGDDVRITTRYDEGMLLSGLFSIIHESGHALYELGFDEGIKGDILADGASTGIHESQSRFWENVLGRRRSFWERYLPSLKKRFPAQLEGVGVDAFFKAANEVELQPIRVEADEVSYGLHVILRFELEKALFSGGLAVKDLPGAFRELARKLLGIEIRDDAEGCLQDIHWSLGYFGYFPGYALGNLYAAQLAGAMESSIGPLDGYASRGDFAPVLAWLRENVHRHGASLSPGELIAKATGSALDPSHFARYLKAKYAEVYGL
jgi:carboxypeptidase Taq